MHNLPQQSLCGPRRESIKLFWTESYNKIMYFIDISDIMATSCTIFSGKHESGHNFNIVMIVV
jgi:hypothetical protein